MLLPVCVFFLLNPSPFVTVHAGIVTAIFVTDHSVTETRKNPCGKGSLIFLWKGAKQRSVDKSAETQGENYLHHT